MNEVKDLFVSIRACGTAIKWAETQISFESAWLNCTRPDWMIWIVMELKCVDIVFYQKYACFCARQNWDKLEDHRSKDGIIAAEQYIAGEITREELLKAKCSAYTAAAADAAVATAYTAADAAAAYAAAAADAAAAAADAAAYAAYAADADAAAADAAADAAAAYAAAAAYDAAAYATAAAYAKTDTDKIHLVLNEILKEYYQ